MEDLLYLHRYKPTLRDTNTICYSHLLGQCAIKNCRRVHVNRGELPDGYCTLICNCLEMGLCQLCGEGRSPMRKNKDRGRRGDDNRRGGFRPPPGDDT